MKKLTSKFFLRLEFLPSLCRYFWDLSVWILIFSPLLTGGVWIKKPGFHIELTELAVPVLIVSLLTVIFHSGFGISLENTSSVRLAKKTWEFWTSLVLTHHIKTVWLGSFAVGTLWALASLRRHAAYGSGAADLGIFTNTIWNWVHGNGYFSSLKNGINLFSDHQSPIFFIFSPLFYFFPFPETLLILQAYGLAFGAIALLKLGHQYLGKNNTLNAVLPLLYWSYLPLRNANAFDFHPECLMLPLFLSALAGVQSEKKSERVLGWIAFSLALGAKESAGPVAAGIGLGLCLRAGPERTRDYTQKRGIVFILLGVLTFLFDTKVVPHFFQSSYVYAGLYHEFGSHLFHVTRLKFLFWTLAPLAFLPLLNWRCFTAAVPGYLMLFLSEGDHRLNPIYHYAIEPSVGLFWALPFALEKIKYYKFNYKIWIIFWALALFGRSEMYRIRYNHPTEHHEWLSQVLIPCLTDDLSFSVSGALVPHLSGRYWIHHLPKLNRPENQWVDCVVFDPAVNNWPMGTHEYETLPIWLKQFHYEPVYSCGSVRVFINSDNKKSCFQCEPSCKKQ